MGGPEMAPPTSTTARPPPWRRWSPHTTAASRSGWARPRGTPSSCSLGRC